MKKEKMVKLFLEELTKIPVVQSACEKTGISRNTIYRWKKEDSDFAFNVDKAIEDGIAFVNDISESQLLNAIKNNDFSAIRYWLSHNHSRYRTKVEATIKQDTNELNDDQKEIIKKSLEHVGIITQ
jgi:ACT domain-containing protein